MDEDDCVAHSSKDIKLLSHICLIERITTGIYYQMPSFQGSKTYETIDTLPRSRKLKGKIALVLIKVTVSAMAPR